jgi:Arc/MetJ-type ribon-helix-helix transcriptional regulator
MADTEKITINMNAVELGKIDLLVEQGHYSNRTDFIRSAIRSQLDKHTLDVQNSVTRDSYAVGAIIYNRKDFEKYKARNEKIKIRMIGLFVISEDSPVELVIEVVESIRVLGIFQASSELKDALAKAGKIG